MVLLGCGKSSESPSTIGVTPNAFLSSANYTSLVLEVVSVVGYEPSPAAEVNLKSFLEARLNKPDGITIVKRTIPSPGKSVYSFDDVKFLESAHRTLKTSGSQLTAFLLLLDGDYSANSGSGKVLGIAYGSSSMALFEKSVQEFSGDVGQPSISTLETAVMDHEFGHILGLVNNGTALQSSHQDTAHGKHCTNTNCLMYFNVETSDVIGNLLGGSVPGLDAACLADLQANGGK